LKGFHLHNADPQNEGSQYVRDTLLRRLESGKVMLPPRIGEPAQEVSMKDLGIGYPILVTKEPIERTFKVRNPEFIGQSSDSGTGGFGHAASDATPAAPQNVPEFFVVPRYSFVVQFVWQPTRMTKRLEKQQAEPARPSDVASTR